METQARSFIQDQNVNVPFKGNGPRAQKNVSHGGRKALADLSNSTKPVSRQASVNGKTTVVRSVTHSKKASSDNISTDYGENAAPRMTSSINELKSSICQVSENNTLKGKRNLRGRKALTDISNSSSMAVPQASKTNCSKKISAVSDENFLHDHEVCINLQKRAVDINLILKTVGLADDASLPPSGLLQVEGKAKVKSPVKEWELMDFAEPPYGVQTPLRVKELELLEETLWSPRCGMSPMHWNDTSSPKFKMMETPKVHK